MASPSKHQEGNGIPWGLFTAVFGVLFLAALASVVDPPAPILPESGLWVLLLVEIVWILTVFDLLREPRFAIAHRALWLAVLVFLNILGSICYMLLKKQYLSSKDQLPAAEG